MRREHLEPTPDGPTWRATCTGCGYDEHRRTRDDAHHDADVARDRIFGHALWLQARCCGGELLSADHLDDLDRMDRYLRARVHLGDRSTGYGPVPGQTRLPYWMMTGTNRAELLAVIAQLHSTALQARLARDSAPGR